jgi:hypothetical protein
MDTARRELISQLFRAAQERPPTERSALFQDACAGYGELQQEVERAQESTTQSPCHGSRCTACFAVLRSAGCCFVLSQTWSRHAHLFVVDIHRSH